MEITSCNEVVDEPHVRGVFGSYSGGRQLSRICLLFAAALPDDLLTQAASHELRRAVTNASHTWQAETMAVSASAAAVVPMHRGGMSADRARGSQAHFSRDRAWWLKDPLDGDTAATCPLLRRGSFLVVCAQSQIKGYERMMSALSRSGKTGARSMDILVVFQKESVSSRPHETRRDVPTHLSLRPRDCYYSMSCRPLLTAAVPRQQSCLLARAPCAGGRRCERGRLLHRSSSP